MLESLYVRDLAIVGEADIAFGSGMTAVTGETGAGKSLLVDALLLLAGARADAGMVRHGCERAELAASFDLSSRADLREWLESEALDEDGACQLRRVIRSEGSSRAWINGRPVTLAQLRSLASGLVAVHGQHEHQALLERSGQLALLDAWGGHAGELATVARLAREWRVLRNELEALSGHADPAERIAWLQHQVEELDRDVLSAEDFAALEERHRRLAHAGQLLQGTAALADRLDGDSDFALLRQLARTATELERLAPLDERLRPVAELVEAARIQLVEATDALARHPSLLDLDPARLEEAEAQLARLHELARKHRVRIPDLPAQAAGLRTELESLHGAGTRMDALRRQVVEVERAHAAAAAVLSARRADAARSLGAAVDAMMAELGMPGGRFEVALEPLQADEPDAQGNERCEFLVSANPGQPPRPLRKVASGGELSRISLAIEVAALGLDATGTMVFDEVDAGIGGAVAEVVGQKLRALGGSRQVLCVTHLPQVASQAHHHLRVSKETGSGRTDTAIQSLAGKERTGEIARMLGGIEITRETLAHARQMLSKAGNGE